VSGSRSSVKSTRRKRVPPRSNAAMTTPPPLQQQGEQQVANGCGCIHFVCASQANASQSAARCKADSTGSVPVHLNATDGISGWLRELKSVRNTVPVILSFPMSANHSRQEIESKSHGPQMVAHAALPTRTAASPFTDSEAAARRKKAVALVRGNLNGKTAPLVRGHSQCLNRRRSLPRFVATARALELSLKKIGRHLRISALSSAGRPRHRLDEQTAGLRTAGRRDGRHGGSK